MRAKFALHTYVSRRFLKFFCNEEYIQYYFSISHRCMDWTVILLFYTVFLVPSYENQRTRTPTLEHHILVIVFGRECGRQGETTTLNI